jgi:hypothetical protein
MKRIRTRTGKTNAKPELCANPYWAGRGRVQTPGADVFRDRLEFITIIARSLAINRDVNGLTKPGLLPAIQVHALTLILIQGLHNGCKGHFQWPGLTSSLSESGLEGTDSAWVAPVS